MTHWEDNYGNTFSDFDEVYEAALETAGTYDIQEYFQSRVSYTTLFDWAIKQPEFLDFFDNEYEDSIHDYIEEHFEEVEDEEED